LGYYQGARPPPSGPFRGKGPEPGVVGVIALNKNRVCGLRVSAPPPGAPPVLGFFVRSAEGLPRSTRTLNWPFRWPLPCPM
jgi:hypothetical protein